MKDQAYKDGRVNNPQTASTFDTETRIENATVGSHSTRACWVVERPSRLRDVSGLSRLCIVIIILQVPPYSSQSIVRLEDVVLEGVGTHKI